MNFTIKHSGNGFIDSTVIEWASPVTRSEADGLAEEIESLLDGSRRRDRDDLRNDLLEQEEKCKAERARLQAELDATRAALDSFTRVTVERTARLVAAPRRAPKRRATR